MGEVHSDSSTPDKPTDNRQVVN